MKASTEDPTGLNSKERPTVGRRPQEGLTGERSAASARVLPLTAGETRIARLVAKGKTSREIADELFLSCCTVKSHMRSILGRLGLRNRVELAIWMISHSQPHSEGCLPMSDDGELTADTRFASHVAC